MGYTFIEDIKKPDRYAFKEGAVFALCPHCQELMYTTWRDLYISDWISDDVDSYIIPGEDIDKRIARIKDKQKNHNNFSYVPAHIRKTLAHCAKCGTKMKFEFLGAKFEAIEQKLGSPISQATLNKKYNKLVNLLEKEYKLVFDSEDIEYLHTLEKKCHVADMPQDNDIAQQTTESAPNIIKYIQFILDSEVKIRCTLQYRQSLKLQKRNYNVNAASLFAEIQQAGKEDLLNLEHTYEEQIQQIEKTAEKELSKQCAIFNVPVPQKKTGMINVEEIAELEIPEPPENVKKGAPNPPAKPIYQKPGLFNRIKVEKENTVLANTYQQQLAKYEQELALYNDAVSKYEAMVANQKAEHQRKKEDAENANRLIELEYENALRDYALQKENYVKACMEKSKAQTEQLIAQVEEKYLAQKQVCMQNAMTIEQAFTENKTKNEQWINDEIAAAEQHIEMLVKGRNTLLAYNIIFPKYRKIPILYTLLEYLNSGRCAALTGHYGAYNIYETEIRSDQMIVQLSQITDVLNVICENQTLLYDEMRATREQTEKLNGSMAKALQTMQKNNANLLSLREDISALHDTEKESLATLKKTRSLTEDIVQETKKVSGKMNKIVKNTAATAHYSAVTAYYSKQTAEMTDALGFMLAMK